MNALATTPRRTSRLLSLSLLLALCLYAIGFWAFGFLHRAKDGELQQITKHIRQHWQTDDVLSWRPWWAQQVRELLGDLPFRQVRNLDTEDLSRFSRLWLIVWPGHDQLGGAFLDGSYQQEDEQSFGRLRLLRYNLGTPIKPIYDLRKNLRDAKVTIHAKGGPRACKRWVEQRWICNPQHWGYVGRVIIEIGTDPREMVWAHPISDGPTEIVYPALPHGSTLRLATGITPAAARVKDGKPIFVTVHIDGKLVKRLKQPNADGLFVHEFDLVPFGPGPHELKLFIETENVSMRHLCYRGEVLP